MKVGNCYNDAFRLLNENAGFFTLVHGFPRLAAGEHLGKRYGHAWLESIDGQWVMDPEKPGLVIPIAEYYAGGQIDPEDCRRFSQEHAALIVSSCGSYGPWGEQPSDVLFYRGEAAS